MEVENRGNIVRAIDNFGARDILYKKVMSKPWKADNE
jgi:hypothetical protein